MNFIRSYTLPLCILILVIHPVHAITEIGEGALTDELLDSYIWDGPLGCSIEDGTATFRLFAPRATEVHVILWEIVDDTPIASYPMYAIAQGCWKIDVDLPNTARYYGYSVKGPSNPSEIFDPYTVVADPYSPAVATINEHRHRSRSLLYPPNDFDWEGDTWLTIPYHELVIYETHVRDLTAHPSSGVPDSIRGAYTGLCSREYAGGLSHLLDLGINAVEFLPVQDFGNMEIPYRDPAAPIFNTWNPYERNHWGYMTSFFFAPESYYTSHGTMAHGRVSGHDGRQVIEFKKMVKTLHKHGIAVILDVVYNHVSQYDYNPLKLIDKRYYFRLDEDGEFLSLSGCGNDVKTERSMARRLIVDSVLHWMREYHIDGFRFDLATMIDSVTLQTITDKARALNPDVLLIAEPWGGGEYDLAKFSRLGWAVWNDRIRNGLKGRSPLEEPGFAFGSFLPGESMSDIVNHLMGSVESGGGPLRDPSHAVNYLESHDDHTLGDFIRLGLGICSPDDTVTTDIDHHIVSKPELAYHKLLAVSLFSSQGIVMVSEGQEFGRSKVIADTYALDPHIGTIDHNSYAKDNETNWLDYGNRDMNRKLVEFYKGLIKLRKEFRGLGGAQPEHIMHIETDDSLCAILRIDTNELGDDADLLVILNASQRTVDSTNIPGRWRVLTDGADVYDRASAPEFDATAIHPRTGMILMELTH